MKILVPVDGSAFTKRMLAYLAAHDEWLGDQQQYTLLHVTPAVPARAASVIDKAVLRGYYTDESEKVFKPLRAFFSKQRIEAAFVAKVGSAADVIAEVANKGKFDLVMMATTSDCPLARASRRWPRGPSGRACIPCQRRCPCRPPPVREACVAHERGGRATMRRVCPAWRFQCKPV